MTALLGIYSANIYPASQQQKYNKNHQGDINDVVLMFLLLTLNVFTPFSSVSIVNFEHVNVSWVQDHFVILFYVSFVPCNRNVEMLHALQ